MTGLISSKVPLRLGSLDTKTDDRWGVPGNLTASLNLVFDNWPKLRKRNGYSQLAKAAAGAQVAAFKQQLLLGTGAEAFGYASSGLVDKGVLESLTVSARAVRRDAFTQGQVDSAVHPLGITVYTWESSAGPPQYSVFDTATGQPIVSGVSLGANAVKPKALALGTNVVIVFYDTSLNHLRYIAIPAAMPASPTTAADLAIDPATSQIFDCTVIGGLNGALYFTYANNAGSNKITLKFLTAQLVLSAATVPTTTEVFNTCTSIFGDGSGNVWVAYYTGSAIKAFVHDGTLSTQLLTFTTVDAAPGTIRNVTGIVSGSTATILYEATGSATYNNLINTGTLTLAGAVSGVGVLVRSVGLASKPFSYLGRVHVLAAYQSALQPTYFLLSGATVVGKLAPSVGGGLTLHSMLPEVNTVSPGVFATTYLQADQLSSLGGNVFTQAGVMAGTFDFTAPQTAIELSDDLHISGGILSMYDGAQVCEHGFHLFPENIVATPSGSGGVILAGTYQYVYVYEWMDAQGLLHQSAPSPAVQVVLSGSTSSVAHTIPTLRLTNKTGSISVVVYRTQANQSVFYRLTSISSPLFNTTTANTVSFSDTVGDSSIGGNAQLIFNPLNPLAEIENLPLPAPLHVWRYRNRIAAIPAENPFEWVFSKAYVGGVPIEFNDQQLFQSVAQEGGPLTCGIQMDEKNILFTATKIYYVVGDGPAPNGTSSDYGSAPLDVPSDVGCTNRKSLVLTPNGVMFQSDKGIHLLGRDMAVRYIGAEVDAFNGLTITAAKLVPKKKRVVFTTNGGVALVYDYFSDKWSVWTNHNAVDMTIFGGLITYVQAGGQLWQETPGQFTDNGAPVLIGCTTTWLSFAGLSGFQRVWRFMILGDYRSPHSLRVDVAYDDNPAPSQSEIVNAGTLLGTGAVADTTLAGTDNPGDGAFPAYEFLVKCKQQKCKSLQITISESQTSPSYGEGLSISAITFLVGGLKALHPVPASRAI